MPSLAVILSEAKNARISAQCKLRGESLLLTSRSSGKLITGGHKPANCEVSSCRRSCEWRGTRWAPGAA